MTILDAHIWIDQPRAQHRLVALDAWTLHCKDCRSTLDLRALATQSPPARHRRAIPNVNDLNACPTHQGQWADTCGPCRSERLARHDDEPPPDPVPAEQFADPRDNPDWIAMREQLGNRKETR